MPAGVVVTAPLPVPAVAIVSIALLVVVSVTAAETVVLPAPSRATAVSVWLPSATVVVSHASESGVGTGLGGVLMVNVDVFEVPPPGVGENPVTAAVPTGAMSAARIVACSSTALTNIVARGLPFQSTTEAATKFVPLTIRVKPAVPALALLGDSELIVGTRLGGMLIVNVRALDVPPPGLGEKTRTAAVPAIARSAAVIT